MLRIFLRKNGVQKYYKIFPSKDGRFQSSHSGSSNTMRYVLPISVGTIGIGAGVVGIASTSDQNRKSIEELVPGSSYLIEAVLGPLEKPQVTPKVDQGLLKKKLEREKLKREKTVKPEKDKEPSLDQPPKEISSPPTADLITPAAPVEKSEPAKLPGAKDDNCTNLENEKPEGNLELTKLLEESIVAAQKKVTAALTAAEDAATAVKEHAEKVYEAIDTDKHNDLLYEAATKVGKVKRELVKCAEDQLKLATCEIESLQKQIEANKESKLDVENKTLPIAEAALTELNYAIKKINSTLHDALENSNAINNYKELVEKGWNQFFEEIRAIIPDAKLGDAINELSREELFLLLIHAHKKVSSLQKSMAKLETVEKDKIRETLLKAQQTQGNKVNDGRLQSELENQRREINLEHRHRLSQLKEDLETELRVQLKRQAAAHSDHLSDVVHAKEKELNRKWENEMLDAVQNERDKYFKSIETMQAQVGGMKNSIKERAEVDKLAHASHLLWMSSEALHTALRLSNLDAKSWEDKILPLQDKVTAIKKSLNESDPFVDIVLSSLPEVALTRGVYSEDALKERFLKVDRVCASVSLVGENGGSVVRYLFSYVKNLLLLNAIDDLTRLDVLDKEMEVDKLNTHDILTRARYCLAKDDLLQTVKYMNLLSGEPRNVAADWLKEAKLTLEAKQAANALMTYASSVGITGL